MSMSIDATRTSRRKPGRPPAAVRSTAATPGSPSIDHDARVRETARLLSLMAEPNRLRLMEILRGGRFNVTELCVTMGVISQQLASHHLTLLRAARLIESRRCGKFNCYALTDEGRKLIDTIAKIGA